MLYCLGLRPLADRLRELTARLYNVYCFSYPLSADSRTMLWPEDFPSGEEGKAPRMGYLRGPRTFEFSSAKAWRGWSLSDDKAQQTAHSWVFSKRLSGLEPDAEFDMGFQAGARVEVTIHVGASAGGSPACALPLAPYSVPDNDDPTFFPRDPFMYRAEVGALHALTDHKGNLHVAFRMESSHPFQPEDVLRLIVAMVP